MIKSQISNLKTQKLKGVTLVELLVIVGILIVLTAITAPAFRFLQKESDLNNSADEIINILRLAQNKTLASEGASQWGVYFNSTTSPHQYTLFKGADYSSRATSSDEIHKIAKIIRISAIDLAGGNEVVFARLTGATNQSGSVSLELSSDSSKTKTIYIENSGQVGLTSPFPPSDANRIKDSRHVHFDYSRNIATSTESLTLTFEGGITETVVIADSIRDGQIYWQREVDVNGEIQKVKIHTHRLNNPDSQFSIHRDRRYNTKALTITISGDVTGSPLGELIKYTATGDETQGSSFYVGEFQLQ